MLRVLALVLVVGLLGSGCGPILSTYLIVSAQADLDGAKAAEADRYSVYEYTAAEEYLNKAREEQGYADFGPAIDYAYKAQQLAQQAKERAGKERSRATGPEVAEPEAAPQRAAPTIRIVPIEPETTP